MSRSGIDWVYDWGNKSGRPVTKPSTSIRPGNDRSMVYTRPGSHHPQPVTYSHWERENVKNSSDRYSTGYRPVDHRYQPATGRERVSKLHSTGTSTYDRPPIDRTIWLLNRSHTATGRERKWNAVLRPGVDRLKMAGRPVVSHSAHVFDRSNICWHCFCYEKIDVLSVIIDKTYNS